MDKRTICAAVMRIDTDKECFDMQQIKNRRFMYDPKTDILILGRQYGRVKGVPSSHAEELADAGITERFDEFVRGWVGTGKGYPHGVIHFAPNIDERSSVARFDRVFYTLEMFAKNGAIAGTLVRGFGARWEQLLFAILTDLQPPEQKRSVREQLKAEPIPGSASSKSQQTER